MNLKISRYINPLIGKLGSSLEQTVSIHTNVRVRFAPSPTGALHIGGARTALYNFIFAKSQGGKFILRIEDTNQEKTIPNADIELEKQLYWLGIPPDESPILGGEYGPYKQSDRTNIYIKYANILLDNGSAYKCFCDEDRLRQIAHPGRNYDNYCRSLSRDESKSRIEQGIPFCIRFKTENKEITFDDLVMGKRTIQSRNSGDTVIIKSSGNPTFFLASVVDDHLMGISHVFRGVEWIPNINLIHFLYRGFDWPIPRFGHLPQLMNADRSKLSKRQGSLSISKFQQDGFSPNVIFNAAIATGSGFRKMNNLELYSMSKMISEFQIKNVATYSAPWDIKNLKQFGKIEYQLKLSTKSGEAILIEDLRNLLLSTYKERLKEDLSDKYLSSVLNWANDRVHNLKELVLEFEYLWTDDINVKPEISVTVNKEQTGRVIFDVHAALSKMSADQFSKEDVGKALKEVRNNLDINDGIILKILRIHICGTTTGPSMKDIFALLGKSNVLNRLKNVDL